MSKIWVQNAACAWGYSTCIAANGCVTSGCFVTEGYARLVGTLFSSGSLKAASGLRVRQSIDDGANWDYDYINTVSTSSGSAFSLEMVGDRAVIEVRVGAGDAATFRTKWWLRPIGG